MSPINTSSENLINIKKYMGIKTEIEIFVFHESDKTDTIISM